MRLIVAGGRDYHLTDRDLAVLDAVHRNSGPIKLLLHGGCRGVDLDADAWAKSRGIPTKAFPPAWDEKGKAAGPVRNEEMAAQADALCVFPGGRGTLDMLNRAGVHGLKIFNLRSQIPT